MKGDFSRIRFTPEKNYTAVLQQQGRVALDADANEQTAIEAYLRDTANVDVIGEYGAPANDAGFAIRIENGKIRIGAGRYYVSGIMVENDWEQDYADQPFFIPSGTSDPSSESSLMTALESGTESVQFILQVWRRFVTELDDPCLVEPAIGQADTTARLQTVWRVIGMVSNTTLAKPASPTNVAGSVTAEAAAPASAGAAAPKSASASASAPAPASASAPPLDVVITVESSGAGGCNQNPIELLSNCCQGLYRLVTPEHSGKMAARTNPAGNDCGCQPIPAAGYQGLENQLYRVEIHTGGDHSTATFKWSRENASVVAQVTNVNGTIITANSLGPDANLGFQVNDWVELIDDTYIFGDSPNQPGVLYQISALGPGPLQVTLNGTPNVNPAMNARMRRWDQSGASAVEGGIPLTAAPMTLEYGIEIDFTPHANYVSGDYWTIPARTADGQIDWACGLHGDPALPPGYFKIYQAPLACAQLDPGSKPPPAGADPQEFQRLKYVIQDCRIKFPPLTAITCGDDGPCTIVPKPGAGWEAPLLALKPGANADICFPVGKFPLSKPLVLSGLGSLRLTGGGLGTEIIATGVSAALIFSKCSSVEISSLLASTDTVITRNKRSTRPPLGGTLSFADCDIVSIDSVGLKCGAGLIRTAACIMVENSYVTQTKLQTREGDPVDGTGEVRIRHCDLEVGGGQEGILLVRVARAQVEDNILVAYVPKQTTLYTRLQNRNFRASALGVFISGAQYLKADTNAAKATEKAGAAPAAPPAEPGAASAPPATGAQPRSAQLGGSAAPPAKRASRAKKAPAVKPEDVAEDVAGDVIDEPVAQRKVLTTVQAGGQTVQFLTHPLLRDFWQPYLDQYAPKIFSTNRDLLLFMKSAARNFLLQPKLTRGNTAVINVIAGLDKADLQAMARGISVGGEGIEECRILNNSIHDAVQGITVGMSNHKQNPFTRETATVVTIAGNQIYVGLPPGAQFHNAQAIFVGNVNSLLVENNCSEVLTNVDEISREGIRVWGKFGRRVIVRHSHLAGFRPGIWFLPIVAPPNSEHPPLWLVADNMAENSVKAVFPKSGPTLPTSVTSMWINNLL
jgi:hypothetical protein